MTWLDKVRAGLHTDTRHVCLNKFSFTFSFVIGFGRISEVIGWYDVIIASQTKYWSIKICILYSQLRGVLTYFEVSLKRYCINKHLTQAVKAMNNINRKKWQSSCPVGPTGSNTPVCVFDKKFPVIFSMLAGLTYKLPAIFFHAYWADLRTCTQLKLKN